MPTTPAADSATAESDSWAHIAARWSGELHSDVWRDLPPIEARVIPEVKPEEDLQRRARRWGYRLADADLSDLATFAAALAVAEAEAWVSGDGVLATQAYEERRFLAADRVVPWAVPWLMAVGRCFPETRVDATEASTGLLRIGEQHRLGPALTGHEGLRPPGNDGYGPTDEPLELADRLGSLWGGRVVFKRSVSSMTGACGGGRRPGPRWLADGEFRRDVATWYEVAAMRWQRMATEYPGTAGYWTDLARRARFTAQIAK